MDDIKIQNLQNIGVVIFEDNLKAIAFNPISMRVWLLDQLTKEGLFELNKNNSIKKTFNADVARNIEEILSTFTKKMHDNIFDALPMLRFDNIFSLFIIKQHIASLCEYAIKHQKAGIIVLFNYKKIDKGDVEIIKKIYKLIDDLSFELHIDIVPYICLPYSLIHQIPQFDIILNSFEYVILEINEYIEKTDNFNYLSKDNVIAQLIFENQDEFMNVFLNLSEIGINKFQISEDIAINLYDELMPYILKTNKLIFIDRYISIILPLIFKTPTRISTYTSSPEEGVYITINELIDDEINMKGVCKKCWVRNLCIKENVANNLDSIINKKCEIRQKLAARILIDYKEIIDNLKNKIKNTSNIEFIKMIKKGYEIMKII